MDNKDLEKKAIETQSETPRETSVSRERKHRFLKSDRYFTISVYVFLTTVCCAIVIKAIFYFPAT